MRIFADWRRRRAARKMAVPLLTELLISYLGSEFYTTAQIKVAFQKLRLDPAYIDLAYARFLDFDIYSETTGNSRSVYDTARLLYQRCLPESGPHSWESAPVNEYVKQLTGPS